MEEVNAKIKELKIAIDNLKTIELDKISEFELEDLYRVLQRLKEWIKHEKRHRPSFVKLKMPGIMKDFLNWPANPELTESKTPNTADTEP